MTEAQEFLYVLLNIAAVGQIVVALLNLSLSRILGWKKDIQQLPLLLQQVVHVHSLYISITATLFAILTLRFASDLAVGAAPVYAWLAAGIAFFWGTRVFIQMFYYSTSHWRGNTRRTLAHITVLTCFSAAAFTYGWAAWNGLS